MNDTGQDTGRGTGPDTPPGTTSGTGAPRRRWQTPLLVVSLTFNLLILGMVAGAVMRDGHDARRHRAQDRMVLRQGGFEPLFDAMPRGAREQMARAFRDQLGARPDKAALAADLRGFVAALRAEPFDASALDAVLAEQHDRARARVSAGRAILVDQVAAMNADERAAFADTLEARFHDALSRAPGRPKGAPAADK